MVSMGEMQNIKCYDCYKVHFKLGKEFGRLLKFAINR